MPCRVLLPTAVAWDTTHRGRFAPDLQLPENIALDWRIYLLRCAPQIMGGPFTLYVGLEHRSEVARKIQGHFARIETDFTNKNRPVSI